MLDRAFNMILRLHSRPATLVRPRTNGDFRTECRITPSNYFRILQAPSDTIIEGREFIISKKILLGFPVELVTFGSPAPTGGYLKLGNMSGDSSAINFDDDATAVQVAVRTIPGYEDVTVTGSFDVGFTIKMINVSNPLKLNMTDNHLDDLDTFAADYTTERVAWSPLIKRGDRIEDSETGSAGIIEVQEINDMGGTVMGYRVRV